MTIEIEREFNRRFFQALNALEATGKIPSLSGYMREIEASPSRYRTMRQQYVYNNELKCVRFSRIEFRVIYETVQRFNLSLEWLYFGTGNMFKSAVK